MKIKITIVALTALLWMTLVSGCVGDATLDPSTNLREFKGACCELKDSCFLFKGDWLGTAWVESSEDVYLSTAEWEAGKRNSYTQKIVGVLNRGQRFQICEILGPNPESGYYDLYAIVKGGKYAGKKVEISSLFGNDDRQRTFYFGPHLKSCGSDAPTTAQP